MNALLLPGNSPRHATWVEELRDALRENYASIWAQHYAHWETGEPWANIESEAAIVARHAQDLGPYEVIAKSIGAVIALQSTLHGALHPQRLILLGIPLGETLSDESFRAMLENISVPILIVQNTHDPFGSFQRVTTLAGDQAVCHELPGDTHDYSDFARLRRIIFSATVDKRR